MFDTILVATDFGALSRETEQKALELARLCQARCILVHVIEAIEDGGTDVDAFYESLKARAAKKLAESVAPFEAAGVSCETRVRVDRRWVGILEAAGEVGADLIVIGSRPVVSAAGKPVLGTTSHNVFFSAECPLLIVRPAPES